MSTKKLNPKSVAAALLLFLCLTGLSSVRTGAARGQTPKAAPAAGAVERRWAGGAKVGEDWVGIRLQGVFGAGRVTGTLSARQLGVVRRPIVGGRVSGRSVHIVVPNDSAPLVLDGVISGERISGTLRMGSRRGPFQLRRIGVADEQALARFAGEYRPSPERLIYVTPQGDALHYVDLKSGRRGWLFPAAASDSTFVEIAPYGAATLAPEPRLTVTFERGPEGRVARALWKEGHAAPLAAPLDIVRREEVSYPSAGATIAGTLYFPKGPPPYPAVLLRGGAGQTTRANFDWVGVFLVEQGFAVLTTDKRGVGKSTGSYESATYDDYAEDLSAGLRFLRGRDDIRREAVGMWGHSEGAWIVPLAAAAAPRDVAFVILSAAIGVPPWQQELFLTRDRLRAEGYSEAEMSDALALRGLMFQVVAANGRGWEELRAGVARHRGARWLDWLIDTTPDRQQFLRQNRDLLHDPAPSLGRLRAPVLALVGECDHFVPAQESRVALARVFAASEGLDYTISVIPGMGHGLQAECGDTDRKGLQVPGYSTEYLDIVRRWLRQYVRPRA